MLPSRFFHWARKGYRVGPHRKLVADEDGSLYQQGVKINASAREIDLGAGIMPTAADIPIADVGGLYEANNVEDALAEAAEGIGGAFDAAKAAQEEAEAKYTLPDGGIPASDLANAVRASLGRADTAMQGAADITAIRAGKVALNGINPTWVNFMGDQVAMHSGTATAPFNLSSNNKTLIVTPDGAGEETITFGGGVKGYHEGAATGLGDISGQPDNKFRILLDHLTEWQTVVLTLTNCDTGANTAAELQTKIRALGGMYSAAVVAFTEDAAGPPQLGTYKITSGIFGTSSKVLVDRSPDANVTEELAIGPDGGTSYGGDGFAANYAVVSAQEVIDKIGADAVNFHAAIFPAGCVSLYGSVAGGSLVVGAGTINAVLAFTAGTYVGAVGLGYATPMADDAYVVVATLNGVTQGNLPDKNLSITNRTALGFRIHCETAAAEHDVDLIIVGLAAAE